jgi:ABC-type amino acid transport system permease subunit
MVVTLPAHNEASELDRRIDLVNVVFGAALGGYIGVVMTRRDLTLEHSIVLCIVLLITVCLLVAIRSILHIWRGTSRGTWKLPMLVVALGIVFFAGLRGDTYLDLAVLIPIFIGWVIAFGVVVSAHVIFSKEVDHGG